jgi:hypothetical protein
VPPPTPGNPSNIRIITVPLSDQNDHLAHGDTLLTTFYHDADMDGYGTPLEPPMDACTAPPGFVANNTDCDDTRAAVHPSAVEIPGNELNDDCNDETPDVVACPCEGRSVGSVSWSDNFTANRCLHQLTPIDDLVLADEPANTLSTVLGPAATNCEVFERATFGRVTLSISSAEHQACTASILRIASADGITCP